MQEQIILIYPALNPGHKPFYSMPPLGVTYLASILKYSGIDVKVIDAEHEGLTIEETAVRALKYHPEAIGISVLSPMVRSVFKIVEYIKKKNRNIRIVLGGPHISATLDECLLQNKDVDFLFFGESEKTFTNFVKNKYKIEGMSDGFAYRENGKVIFRPKKTFIEELDSLPYPDFRLIDNFNLKKYKIPYSNKRLFIPVMASRGCYHDCTFCEVNTIHGKKLRVRTPENIFNEIKSRYFEQNIKYFVFKDSSMTLNRDWIEKLCDLIINSRYDINWRCNCRTDEVDENLLRKMKKAGCNLITYGIESGAEKILSSIKKDTTLLKNYEALYTTHKIGIETHSIFIIGSPGETTETIKQTIDFAKKTNSLFVQFGKAIAYPRNGFYFWGIEKGFLKDKFWYLKEHVAREETFLFNPHTGGGLELPGIDQEYWIKKAFLNYYFRFSYFIKLFQICIKNPYLIVNMLNTFYIFYKFLITKNKIKNNI